MIRSYNDTEVSINIMYLNSVLFLTIVSKGIYYGIILATDNLEYETFEKGLKNVVRSYLIRKFYVILILIDI